MRVKIDQMRDSTRTTRMISGSIYVMYGRSHAGTRAPLPAFTSAK